MKNTIYALAITCFLACSSEKSKQALETENKLLLAQIDSLRNPFKEFDKQHQVSFEEAKTAKTKIDKERKETQKMSEEAERQSAKTQQQKQLMEYEMQQRVENEKKAMVRNNIFNYVKTYSNYDVQNFGGLTNVYAGIHNQSDYWIEEVGLTLTYITTNNYVHKTEYLILRGIPPKTSKSQYAPNTTRGVRLTTKLHYIYSSALDLRQAY